MRIVKIPPQMKPIMIQRDMSNHSIPKLKLHMMEWSEKMKKCENSNTCVRPACSSVGCEAVAVEECNAATNKYREQELRMEISKLAPRIPPPPPEVQTAEEETEEDDDDDDEAVYEPPEEFADECPPAERAAPERDSSSAAASSACPSPEPRDDDDDGDDDDAATKKKKKKQRHNSSSDDDDESVDGDRHNPLSWKNSKKQAEAMKESRRMVLWDLAKMKTYYGEDQIAPYTNLTPLDELIEIRNLARRNREFVSKFNWTRNLMVRSWIIMEKVATTMGLDASNFAAEEQKNMDQYEDLLREISEKYYISFTSSWPPEFRLGLLVLFNFTMFYVGRKYGQQAKSAIRFATGYATGGGTFAQK